MSLPKMPFEILVDLPVVVDATGIAHTCSAEAHRRMETLHSPYLRSSSPVRMPHNGNRRVTTAGMLVVMSAALQHQRNSPRPILHAHDACMYIHVRPLACACACAHVHGDGHVAADGNRIACINPVCVACRLRSAHLPAGSVVDSRLLGRSPPHAVKERVSLSTPCSRNALPQRLTRILTLKDGRCPFLQ